MAIAARIAASTTSSGSPHTVMNTSSDAGRRDRARHGSPRSSNTLNVNRKVASARASQAMNTVASSVPGEIEICHAM